MNGYRIVSGRELQPISLHNGGKMDIKTEKKDNVLIVSVSGSLDASNHQQFTETVQSYIEEGARHLLFNLQGLEYMSSAGIRAFIMIERFLSPFGGVMVFYGLVPFVDEIFEIAGLKSDFKVFEDEASALSSFSSVS